MTDTPTTNIVFLLFPGITQLDFTAPAQALSRMPGAVLAGAAATIDPIMTDSGFAISKVALQSKVTVPGIDPQQFDGIIQKAKAGCPVSQLLKAEITLDYKLN